MKSARISTRLALVLAAALVTGGLLPGVAGAFPGGGPHSHHFGGHHGPDGFIERHADRLGLDDQQRGAIRAIVDASWAEAAPIEEASHEAHEELRRMLDVDEPDEAAIMAQVELLGALQTDSHKLRMRTMLSIRRLLTPEQRAEMVSIHEEKRERFGERHPGGPCPGED